MGTAVQPHVPLLQRLLLRAVNPYKGVEMLNTKRKKQNIIHATRWVRACHTAARTGACALAFAICAAAPGQSAAQDPRAPVGRVVKQMQIFYNKTKDLKGKFKQVYTDTLYNRRRTSYGYLYVRKPGMMRWNYASPERKSFIADGKELWVWEPRDKQAFRNPLSTSTLSSGLTFLLGAGDLAREFQIVYATAKEDQLGGPGGLVLKLLPKKPTAQYQYLLLSLRKQDFAVTESMVVSKHSRNHFLFTKIKTNTKLASALFRFKPPEGTRIIDGSKLKR